MIIISGSYAFSPKITAFRCDYCRRCGRETISNAKRTFDVGHLFWVPVLPLGFRTKWFCITCNHRPHEPVSASRPFRIAMAIFSFIFALLSWLMVLGTAIERDPDMPFSGFIPFLAALTVAIIFTVVFVRQVLWSKDYTSDNYKIVIASIKPYDEPFCPLCSGRLVMTSLDGKSCEQCNAEHRPLKNLKSGFPLH